MQEEIGFITNVDEEEQHEFGQSLTIVPDVTKLLFFMLMVRATVGVGILTLPSAVANAGFLVGTLSIAAVSAIMILCHHFLVDCAQFLRERYNLHRIYLDYGNTAVYVFRFGARGGRYLRWSAVWLDICISLAQFGFCTVYLLFIAKSVNSLVKYYHPEFKQSVTFYLSCVAFSLLPLIFICTVRSLAKISSAANIVMIIGLAMMVQYCCTDVPDVSGYPLAEEADYWPLTFSVAVFAFESINAVLIFENDLIDKKSLLGWKGLINLSLGFVLVVNVTVGTCGYVKFGQNSTGQLTDLLPMTPWYYMAIKPIYAALIALSFGLQYQILIEVVWKRCVAILPARLTSIWGNLALRLLIFLVMFGVAAGVPHIEQMVSLTGGLTGSCVCLIFPPLLHTVLFWNEPTRHKACGCFAVYITRNMLIMVFGIVGCIIGTSVSVLDIIDAFKNTPLEVH